MSRINTYLNFQGTTEEAFNRYASIFNPNYSCHFMRFGDMPEMPPMSDDDSQKIMHVELPIIGGHVLMGTDMLTSHGQTVKIGNNTTISIEIESRDEALRLYEALAENGSESTGMNDMPWGAYWGCCLDSYGIRWMVSTPVDMSGN